MLNLKQEAVKMDDVARRGKKLADEHVEWFLKTIGPLLKDHMAHGYKHGRADGDEDAAEERSGYASIET